jgi:hypothetical protein
MLQERQGLDNYVPRNRSSGSAVKHPHPNRSPIEAATEMLVPIVSVLLRSGLATADFMSAAKLAYVRAATLDIGLNSKKPNVSRISASTGLTRREITSLLRLSDKNRITKLTEAQPLVRVIRGWQNDRRFSHKTGQPRMLSFSGAESSFENLVRVYGGDVTVMGVLRELERLQCVRRVGKERVRLVRKQLMQPGYGRHAVARYARRLNDFAATLDSQFKPEGNRVYLDVIDNRDIADEMFPIFQKTFTERAAMLLEGFEAWTRRNASSGNFKNSKKVGLGVYLIAPGRTPSKQP